MAKFEGTAASEALVGTGGDDIIVGGGGTDRIDGGPGGDTLTGGDEADRIDGESGDDVVEGGGGADSLRGGAGDDLVHGGEGDDYIFSDESGSDQLFGDEGDDTIEIYRYSSGSTLALFGGAGNDVIYLGALAAGNSVAVDTGEGIDWVTVTAAASAVALTLGTGRDIVAIRPESFGTDLLKVAVRISDWEGGAGGDIVHLTDLLARTTWNPATNPFAAGYLQLTQMGADVVLSASRLGGDQFEDAIVFENRSLADFTAENFRGFSPDGSLSPAGHVTGTDATAEYLTGGGGDDLIEGLSGRDIIYAGAGDDVVEAGDGNDYVDGAAGDDEIEGGLGNDSLYGGAGSDLVHGGDGNDRLEDRIPGGADELHGDGGDDYIYVYRATGTIGGMILASGGEGSDSITLGVYNSSIVTLDAGAGDDIVSFVAARDLVDQTITLGSGADVATLSFSTNGKFVVTRIVDFETGDFGDRLNISGFLQPVAVGAADVSTPFASGFLRLVQSGTDVVLQLDRDGSASAAQSWVSLVVFSNADAAAFTAYNLSGYGVGDAPPAGLVISGTADADPLRGNFGADQIGGQDGDDAVAGLGGNDELSGGLGNDRLSGDAGDDLLLGGEGDDVLTGGDGNDRLEGFEGADYFSPGAGNDLVYGGGGNDTIVADSLGSDSVHGDDGDDVIRVIRGFNTADEITVTGDAGNDTITLSAREGTLIQTDSGSGDDRVVLDGPAANRVTLGEGRDTLELAGFFGDGGSAIVTDFEAGDRGDAIDFNRWLARFGNTLDPNANPFVAGTMRLVQAGPDTLVQFDSDGAGTASGWVTLLTLQTVDAAALTAANFDNYRLLLQSGTESGDALDGTSADDVLDGKGGDDLIRGFEGADRLHGDSGNDTIDGGDGDDDMFGDEGDDVLAGGAGFDILDGGAGNDQLDGGEGSDTLYYQPAGATPDHDVVDGGAGEDRLVAEFSNITGAAGITMILSGDAATGYSGTLASGADHSVAFTGVEFFFIGGTDSDDVVTTGDFADILILDAGNDVIVAGGGADWLIGGEGADSMTGGAGNDRYDVDNSGDVVLENADEGYDTVETVLASYALLANFENLTGLLATGQVLTGNDLANLITGGAGNDVLDGGLGADEMSGGAGNDIFYVDDAGDVVNEAGGIDEIRTSLATFTIAPKTSIESLTGTADSGQILTGNTINNTIRGGVGGDQLYGEVGSDTLIGGAGNDLLDGGTQTDTMRGEQGDDTYSVDTVFDSAIENADEGIDTVLTALATYTLGANVENLTGTAAVAQTLRGNALDNVVNGGAGSDTLYLQGGGADKAFGHGGADHIYFGGTLTSADTADGGAGDDWLILQGDYSAGLVFSAGMVTGFEHLQLLGRTHTIYGGSSVNPNSYTITTHDSNVGPIGWFAVDGGSLGADESLIFDGSGDTDGRFWVIGGAGADRLTGSGGNDLLNGGAGADTLIGGLGNDVYNADNGDTIVEAANGGTDYVETRSATFTLAANIETLIGKLATGQILIGNSGDNVIEGDAGADTLDGGGGIDTLKGNGGNDILRVSAPGQVWAQGGAGADILMIDWSAATAAVVNTFNPSFAVGPEGFSVGFADWGAYYVSGSGIDSVDITTGSGNDIIKTGPGNDRVILNGGDDLLDAGSGSNVADGGTGVDGLDLDLSGATAAIAWNIAADSHSGVAGSYTNFEYFAELQTGSGNDSIVTGAGERQEFIYTYAGNDSVSVFGGRDTVFAGSGLDTLIIDYSAAVEAIATLGIVEAADGMGGTFGDSGAHKVNFSGIDRFVFTGGTGDDSLMTGAGDDVLSGGEGDDSFDANGGNDSLTGGAGNDILRGRDGNDILIGGIGNDTLNGGAGVDTMTGGTGDDLYVIDSPSDVASELEGEGTDRISTSLATYVLGATFEELAGNSEAGQTLTGNAGDNVISAWTGDDVIDGGAGNDQISGGLGLDTLSYSGRGAGITAMVSPAWTGTVTLGAETDSFALIETIVGTDFADSFTNAGSAPMTFVGGAGDDVYRLTGGDDILVEAAGGGTDRVFTSAAVYTLGANLENLTGTAAATQDLRGNALANEVTGGTGDDILRLHDGGADRAAGGDGGDSLYFGAGFGRGDIADGGQGFDWLLLQGGYAGLVLGAGISGIEGIELMSHSDARLGGAGAAPNSYSIVSGGFSQLTGLLLVSGRLLEAGETLSFDGSADTGIRYQLVGGAANDVLTGGALDDVLDGAGGADRMTGGLGDDFYWVLDVDDEVVEQAGEGADTIATDLAVYTLGANVENLKGVFDIAQTLTGNALANQIQGGGGDDILDGGGAGDAPDYLEGGDGADRLLIGVPGMVYAYGGSGIDTLVVDYSLANGPVTMAYGIAATSSGWSGHYWGGLGRAVAFTDIDRIELTGADYDDEVVTGGGDDRLILNGGGDRADGGAGDDLLDGGAGNDTLLGGDGDDRLDGGAGSDSLSGGTGDDLYVADSGDQIFEHAGEGVDEVRTGAATYVLGADLEKLTATGSGEVPLALRGNGLDNVITTEVGAATVYLQDGGADAGYGATHADTFYFGAAFGAGDRVDGGLGSDTIVLQGAYGPLTLTAGTMIGIQTLALLSAGDDRFGGAAAGAYSYDILVAADFSSAIPSPLLPFIGEEGELLIDGSGLGAGETLHFDGSAADPALGYLTVKGGGGGDHLIGSAGGDSLSGGGGDDVIEGGGGGDYLEDSGGESNILRGGDGDDLLFFGAESWATLGVEGGNGDDRAVLNAYTAGAATLDMGAGNDRVEIWSLMGGTARLTLGAGQDMLTVGTDALWSVGNKLGAIVVADFEAGDGGDRFEWPADLASSFPDWAAGPNPFAAGYARLVRDGADTLLQVSLSANGDFATLVRFENRSPSDFTGGNFGGASPLPVTGGSGADQLHGTHSSDYLFGAGGNDFLYLEDGGDDFAYGGEGNDVLYFGGAFTGADRADGGDGRDAIALQGNVTAVLSDTNLTGIESISVQSGANDKFGDTANNFYDFDITTSDGNVAAGQQLIVNAQSLRAGEDFTFDGSAESDGRFLVYGGHGVDDLTGGDGVDVFFFEGQRWGPDDHVDGGGGRDSMVISAGSGLTHIEFGATSFTNIESISVNNRYATDPSQKPSYELVLHNGNVAPGGTLIVNGSSIPAGQIVNIDGRGVHDGNLILFGGGGHDVLTGGDGVDLIVGGAGADALTGGAGADIFRYDAASDSTSGSTDQIAGFQSGTDKIDLTRVDADSTIAGNQAFAWIGSDAFTHVAGQLRAFESGGTWFVQGDTNGDGVADLVIEVTTQGATPLVQGDFLP